MKTLDQLGLAEKTLVVFCSDNGPVLDDGYQDGAVEKNGDHRPSGIYSGGKYSILEGGTRTPFITRWKGRIQPGVSDKIVCTIDLAASLAALVDVPLDDDACLDSFNVLEALLGKPKAKGRDHLVQQDNGRGGNYGLRMGNWKIQRHDSRKARNVSLRLESVSVPQYQLFNLADDPGERNDVFAKYPEVGERLKSRLAKLIADGRSR